MFTPVKHVKLTATVKDNGISLDGSDTFHLKDVIKTLGGVWHKETRTWTLPLDTGMAPLQAAAVNLGIAKAAEKEAEKIRFAYQSSPEGKLERVKAAFASGQYYWICCEKCEVHDWRRKHTSCIHHAVDGNSFRVDGMIYTGD